MSGAISTDVRQMVYKAGQLAQHLTVNIRGTGEVRKALQS